MEMDAFQQLEQTAAAFGLPYQKYQAQETVENEAERRLCKILGTEPEIGKTAEEIAKLCTEGTLYIKVDSYQRYGMLFLDGTGVVEIGLFMVDTTEEILQGVMEKNQIPVIFQKELREYYNSLPLVKDLSVLESLIMANMKDLLDENTEIVRAYIEDVGNEDTVQYNELQLLEENKVSMETIESRYKIEDRFMEAIRSGNIEKVLEIEKIFFNYRLTPRVASQFRNSQNMLIVLNTLMRRAVQDADVHPAHIDHLSTDFANKIEMAKNEGDLRTISRAMTRKYCMLVQNYSLAGHSKIVRDAMNYIDFNLNEDLSLNVIAEKFAVSASYLSKQFKKENEMNLTEYVNRKRLGASLKYLAATDLPIQNIAELVGIYDENYFSRLFKKYQQMTPSQYRSLMKNE